MQNLQCGCCGKDFIGIQNVSHDTGYGDCPSCEETNQNTANAMLDNVVKQIEEAFSPEKAKSFKKKTLDQKRNFAMLCIDKGLVNWSIG